MTPDQIKVLFEYLESIQKGVGDNNKDKEDDHTEQLKKYSDLMLAITANTTAFNLMTDEVKNLIKEVRKQNKNTLSGVDTAVKSISETVEGKTRVLVKDGKTVWQKWVQNVRNRIKKPAIEAKSSTTPTPAPLT